MNRRLDAVGAMSAATAYMTASAAGVAATHRFAAGVGSQGGESAFAVGYQRGFREGRTIVTLGGAFSRDDTSVGAGVGFGF